MSLPFRVAGTLVLRAIDAALGIGIKLDEWLSKRKQEKGLSFKDVAHIKAQSEAGAAHRTAKTVVIRRP